MVRRVVPEVVEAAEVQLDWRCMPVDLKGTTLVPLKIFLTHMLLVTSPYMVAMEVQDKMAAREPVQ
jgi:hypothetical protein